MNQNTFLRLCQQAENNQSYELANYLTWLSHQSDTGYTARLYDDDKGLRLIVNEKVGRKARIAMNREDRRDLSRVFDIPDKG